MKSHKYFNCVVTIIAILGVFTLLFSNILKKPVGNLDELWNYNTARQIMNGLVPYKDISMITTPLLPTTIAIILKLTTDELMVFRILTAFFSTVIIFMTYKILKLLLKNKLLSTILTGYITYIYYKNFMLDYNFVVLIITLIIEYLELKRIELNTKDNYKFDLFIGFLAGLAICTKQTIGVFVSTGVLLVKLLFVKNKDEFKHYIKNALVRCIGILLPCTVFLGFLLISGALNDFINYALLGIKTFSNSIPYTVLIKDEMLAIKVLSIILPIFLSIIMCTVLISIIQKKSSDIMDRIKIMTVFSSVMLIVIYPISDRVHFLVAILPLLIEFLYVIFTLFRKVYEVDTLKYKKNVMLTVGVFFMVPMIIIGSFNIYKNINEYKEAKLKEEEYEKLSHYNNIVVPDYINIRAENIKNLIENSKENVIILDADAVVFNIPENVYYKNYSMFLKGNIGKDGEDGIIEDIKNSSNCLFIVKKQGIRLNWQTPTKVLEYVRQNLQKQGEINECEIYKTKN